MNDLPAGNSAIHNSVRLPKLGTRVPLFGGAAKIGRPLVRVLAPVVRRHCRQFCGNFRAAKHHEAAPPAGQVAPPTRPQNRISNSGVHRRATSNDGCAKSLAITLPSAASCECVMVDTRGPFDKLHRDEKDARFRKVVCIALPAKGGLSRASRRGVLRSRENVARRVRNSPTNPDSWHDSEFLPPISLVAVSFDEYQNDKGARTYLVKRRIRRLCATLEIPLRGIRHAPCKAPHRNSRPPGQVSEEMAE